MSEDVGEDRQQAEGANLSKSFVVCQGKAEFVHLSLCFGKALVFVKGNTIFAHEADVFQCDLTELSALQQGSGKRLRQDGNALALGRKGEERLVAGGFHRGLGVQVFQCK